MFQYYFTNDLAGFYRPLYNCLLFAILVYISIGVCSVAVVIFFIVIYLETLSDVLNETLMEVKHITSKTARCRKLLVAHKQHLYLIK